MVAPLQCRLLADKRKTVEREELREWRTRHSRNKNENKKEKGPVEPGKEEEDKLESFFCHLYEFHNPVVPNVLPDVISDVSLNVSTSAYVVSAPALSVSSVPVSAAQCVSSDFSLTSPSCIGTTQ